MNQFLEKHLKSKLSFVEKKKVQEGLDAFWISQQDAMQFVNAYLKELLLINLPLEFKQKFSEMFDINYAILFKFLAQLYGP